ncbi:HAD family hydrolase [Natronorubrum bangense]|uniref:HAD family hydrolase n=2 Tax=Natronorubrum bangense TaxID=61858 RepID=A0A4D6HQU8_9EURY|nr:HAD family hydrolase [Natronorubrum bangense]ELY44024.1 HAD-superfamily hydrolase [Natronorubrum bangense JCM 10635]QCC53054.1 HAD family hydrolase [Natronorubrum bangense]QCC56253.1 HAD family hydrolase [Natronorubrum bangense]
MPRAVVFDLDYTLAVPTQDRTTILQEAAATAGAPPLTREAYLEAHRRNLTRETREPIFADLLEGRETDAEPAAVADAYRQTIAETLEPLPGVEAMLEDLKGEYRVGLLTNGPVRAQRDKLTTLGWERVFDAALVTGELEAGKPDHRAFDAIVGELDVAPDEAVYIGDEVEADIYGATNAGLEAVQVLLEDGPDPDPRATAHVEQSTVGEQVPDVVGALETR